MGETEVTQAQYEAVMNGANPSNNKGANNPVERVSWNAAVEFCNALSARSGLPLYYDGNGTDEDRNGGIGYRLPTEAEWEYAAGGGATGRTKYAGTDYESALTQYAVYYSPTSANSTKPVRDKKPNRLGLYDMSGNVYEWVYDWHPGYVGTNRVVRGGSYTDFADHCAVAYRSTYGPGNISSNPGFRVVRSVRPKDDITTSPSTGNIKLLHIDGGSFDRGDYKVTVSDFYMGETEVTQAQYVTVTGKANPSNSYGVGGDYPVYYVSWEDAVRFCNELSRKENLTSYYSINGTDVKIAGGIGYRLATAAEWEYAAGGGATDRTTYAGTSDPKELSKYAVYGNMHGPSTQPVKGERQANRLGLYDMSGNVWDWYGDYPAGATTNPTGPTTGSARSPWWQLERGSERWLVSRGSASLLQSCQPQQPCWFSGCPFCAPVPTNLSNNKNQF